MSSYHYRWAATTGLILLIGLIVVVTDIGARPLANPSVAGDWGQPCLPLHPSACYVGTSGQSSQLLSDLTDQMERDKESSPSAVELICFYVEAGDRHVEVEWETASELETLGFHLLRSNDPEGPFEDLSGFVPHCDDGGLVGGLYRYDDQSVANDHAYYYRLKEVVNDQHYVYYPPLSEPALAALPGAPTLAATQTAPPTPTATQRPSTTPTPTMTKTPSPTPSPTALPTSTPVSPTSPPVTSTSIPTVIARTFTPTPSPTATGKAAAAAVPSVLPSLSITPNPVATTSVPEMTPELTPEVIVVAATAAVDSPLPTPPSALSLTAYPSGMLAAPTRIPDPTQYVPPPGRHSANQIATMTPIGSARTTVADSGGLSPRVWLYVGFVGSALLLIAGLIMMVRHWQDGGNPPSHTGRSSNSLHDRRDT